ncbi:MAG: VTT domain-containing protein [Gemmatimonadaceae bacterium]|nr:VTT domain-containing protein [Gemmatimonadaceae bacterium]
MLPTRSRLPILRALVLLLLVGALIVLVSADTLHDAVIGVLEASRGIIAAHPVAGPAVFLALAALSAMAGFVSSAVLVPAAVFAWGAVPTMAMLWVGWMLGGVFAHQLATHFGRPILRWLVPDRSLGRYERLLDRQPRFSSVLLFQLALPSEIPGYLLGLVRYPVLRYLGAMAIAELPYAVGTVLLGVGFVERDTTTLVAVSVTGIVMLIVLARVLQRLRRA